MVRFALNLDILFGVVCDVKTRDITRIFRRRFALGAHFNLSCLQAR